MLPTNFKDDVLDTSMNDKRVYNIRNKTDGSLVESNVTLEDVTVYSQNGTPFGANVINEVNQNINTLNVNLNEFQFRMNEEGKGEYKLESEGADAWRPFKSDVIHNVRAVATFGANGAWGSTDQRYIDIKLYVDNVQVASNRADGNMYNPMSTSVNAVT